MLANVAKKVFLFMLIIHIAPFALAEGNQIVTYRHPTGEKNIVITIVDDSRIIRRGYYEDGTLRFEQTLIDGYREGKYVSWFRNGQPSVTGQYEKGRPVGKFLYYREDGSVGDEKIYTKEEQLAAGLERQIAKDAKIAATKDSLPPIVRALLSHLAYKAAIKSNIVESLHFVDIDMDGEKDALYLYDAEPRRYGGNYHSQYLALFLNVGSDFELKANSKVGGKGERFLSFTSVEDGKINFNTSYSKGTDASCCPSGRGTATFIFDGNRLQEITK